MGLDLHHSACHCQSDHYKVQHFSEKMIEQYSTGLLKGSIILKIEILKFTNIKATETVSKQM